MSEEHFSLFLLREIYKILGLDLEILWFAFISEKKALFM